MQELQVPRLKPAAVDTWELRDDLLATDIETARSELQFPGPYMIVGCHVSVIQSSNAGSLLIPDADDIMVLLDLDNQRRFTAGNKIGQTSAATQGIQYVTLSSLDTEFRDLLIIMESPKPVIGATFRWKLGAAAANLYEDASIGIAFYATQMTPADIARYKGA